MRRKLFILIGAGLLCLPACSTRQLIDIASASDPKQALRRVATNRVEAYKYNPQLILSDLRKAEAEYNRLMGNVQKESGAKWGKKESRTLPSSKRYVKYTENYKNRVVVDYDAGSILIEHLDEASVKGKLRNAVVVALLTPSDPGAVDLFSDKEVTLNGDPYLEQMVADQNGNMLKSREDVERYADYLVDNRLQSRSIDANGTRKNVYFVRFDMVNSHLDKRAVQYAATVRRHSENTQVSRSLIYAVIKTESAFNPYAVSSAPAYGMMQLVPSSGGREAYRKAKGQDVMPSKEYLFDANNNIELGSTYLGVLLKDSPLREIRDPVSREYCAIAAYNTGPSNVMRAFSQLKSSRDRQYDAINKINTMKPEQVYEALRTKLPYEETRGYIVKVVAAKKLYAVM
ncbi:murein transglycosylase domain-containing protein [Sideroxydans sp.]